MTVDKLMSKSIVSVKMDDIIGHVKDLFEQHSFHHLLVVDAGKLVGVVSDRDLLKAISPNLGTAAETVKDSMSLSKRVHKIMSRKIISVTPDTGLFHALQLFNQNKISCLPVVDKANHPVGILTWRDILKHLEISSLERHRKSQK